MSSSLDRLKEYILRELSEGILYQRRVLYVTKKKVSRYAHELNMTSSQLTRAAMIILKERFPDRCLIITRSKIIFCRREDYDYLRDFLEREVRDPVLFALCLDREAQSQSLQQR